MRRSLYYFSRIFGSTLKEGQDYEKTQKVIVINILNYATKKGIEEGKFEVAKKLFAKGMNIEDISEVTSLTIEEIKKLINK